MKGLLIGGLLASVFFGLTGVIAKFASNSQVGISVYLLSMGIGFLLASLPFFLLTPASYSPQGIGYSVSSGIAQACGMACVLFAMHKYSTPMSQLAPLYNTNTLIAVVLSLVIFSEWQSVSISKVLLGSLFIIFGAAIVSTASK